MYVDLARSLNAGITHAVLCDEILVRFMQAEVARPD